VGHIASFDRRKCKRPLNGPGAEKGEKCPEGFTFYPLSGPGFQGDPGAEENPYYVWVDWFNILGLGPNVPFETGNQSDSLHALVGGQIVELRVPHPMGFFAKGLEGRLDDPKAGWKGRELWVTSGIARRSTSKASTRRHPARPVRHPRRSRARSSSNSSYAPTRSPIRTGGRPRRPRSSAFCLYRGGRAASRACLASPSFRQDRGLI
jgi:hypothetical protein